MSPPTAVVLPGVRRRTHESASCPREDKPCSRGPSFKGFVGGGTQQSSTSLRQMMRESRRPSRRTAARSRSLRSRENVQCGHPLGGPSDDAAPLTAANVGGLEGRGRQRARPGDLPIESSAPSLRRAASGEEHCICTPSSNREAQPSFFDIDTMYDLLDVVGRGPQRFELSPAGTQIGQMRTCPRLNAFGFQNVELQTAAPGGGQKKKIHIDLAPEHRGKPSTGKGGRCVRVGRAGRICVVPPPDMNGGELQRKQAVHLHKDHESPHSELSPGEQSVGRGRSCTRSNHIGQEGKGLRSPTHGSGREQKFDIEEVYNALNIVGMLDVKRNAQARDSAGDRRMQPRKLTSDSAVVSTNSNIGELQRKLATRLQKNKAKGEQVWESTPHESKAHAPNIICGTPPISVDQQF